MSLAVLLRLWLIEQGSNFLSLLSKLANLSHLLLSCLGSPKEVKNLAVKPLTHNCSEQEANWHLDITEEILRNNGG